MRQTQSVVAMDGGLTVPIRQWGMGLLLAALLTLTGITPARAQDPAAPKAGQSEVLPVGDLSFQVTSLRVTPIDRLQSTATLSMTIRNNGKEVVFLNATRDTAKFTNDLGYQWRFNVPVVTGIPLATTHSASLNSPIEPGREMRIQYVFKARLAKGQTIGAAYDFIGEFQSVEDLGEGRLKTVRSYPVSFIGLTRSGFANPLSGLFGSKN